MERVLVVGAGGVGCEVLLVLAASGRFRKGNVAIVDGDTVEASNLHRQCLYGPQDVGQAKAHAATARLSRDWDMTVVPVASFVEEIDDLAFFRQFNVFVLAVDRVSVRRWINAALLQAFRDRSSITHGYRLVDIGVRGFTGSVRLFRSWMAADPCIECTSGLFEPDVEDQFVETTAAPLNQSAVSSSVLRVPRSVPICSVRGQPQTLEQCIQWALYSGAVLDGPFEPHNPRHLQTVHDAVCRRAQSHAINPASLSFAMIASLARGAIPAVASVNAIVAAQAIAMLLVPASETCNFRLINLEAGVYSHSVNLERDLTCVVCQATDC